MTAMGQGWTGTGGSTALLTDQYELTMLDAALRSGVAAHRAVFECFTRRLPTGRRYGVVAGTGRLLEALTEFRFGAAELQWLRAQAFLHADTLDWLAGYRFGGTISGYREGELYGPGSPVLTVEAAFGEAVVLETLVLSILNHDSAVAAAGSRMVLAAAGRPLIEAGTRRTAEYAGPAAARAAHLVGFAATSNLEAGRRWGGPTGGTAAHALILAHPDERHAFAAQVAMTGPDTTLLIDTYDVAEGVRNAVAVAGPGLGAVRIDSGDLAEGARTARRVLDGLGAHGTRIVLSGDLDEHQIARFVSDGVPVDRMLIGTELVTGSGAPTAGFVYKLVAIASAPGPDAPLQPVAKRSAGKATVGGRKVAARRLDGTGHACGELVVTDEHRARLEREDLRLLQHTFVVDGLTVDVPSLAAGRDHHARVLAELPPAQRALAPGEAFLVAAV
jgi:nicotinate phosphoribosyltransferase